MRYCPFRKRAKLLIFACLRHLIDEPELCARGEKGTGASIGDLGSPLGHETESGDFLISLVSMFGIIPKGRPSTFSRVSSAMDWPSECIELDKQLRRICKRSFDRVRQYLDI